LTAVGAAAQPVVFDGGVIDNAQFEPGRGIAPGSLVAIFGSGLASSLQQGDTVPLSAEIGGVSVTFNGIVAPLYFVSPGQIVAQLPWDILPSDVNSESANIVVKFGDSSSAPKAVPIAAFAPAVFAVNTNAGRYGIVINLDSTLAAPTGLISGLNSHPAHPGDVVIMYANGLGAIDSTLQTGFPGGDILRRTLGQPVVLVGGQNAEVQFSGLTPNYPGVNQMNFRIPPTTPGDKVPIQVRVGGLTSTDQVFMSVAP
jgi:uncharacterized protein (TIGR03437 family)